MIIGTAGHIDHGKTALVKALTGIAGDRLSEEKARGITIELGFAYADLGGGGITGFVDVPGHERLVRTMLAGAGGIDFALLVVAADDGVMPQTLEHLAILDLLGLSGGIVAMTKADLADSGRRAQVQAQIRAALAGTGLADAPIMPVSATTGEGIDALRAALVRAAQQLPARAASGPFRFAVDRSFTLAGTGTVVTGTVLSGKVTVGDGVMISPLGLPARVRGIHAQNLKSESGVAGQRCALNLAGEGVGKDAIHRGDLILTPPLHAPSDRIDAVLRVLGSENKPVTTWFPVHLHSHAVEVPARVVPLAGELKPGQAGLVQIVLERPIAASVGDRFVLRDTSASRSIGGGHFIDLRAPARKRGTPERLAWLQAARNTDPATALAGLLAVAPVDMPAFLRDRALDQDDGPALCAQCNAVMIEELAVSVAHLAELETQLGTTLADFHETHPDLAGLGREKLRLLLQPRLPKPAFLAFLQQQADAGKIVLDGAFVRLPGHVVQLAEADALVWQRIQPGLLGEGRFRPPRVRDFAHEFDIDERDIRRILKLVQRQGLVYQVAHDHFFAREVVREMAGFAKDLAAGSDDGWFGAAAFRDCMDNGRKVAIQILDFFDGLGLTLRRGDLRRINPHRRDLFDG
ncbi:MAG: selenocysteine-specific translation elongation factor [Gammaproteobacteria bacterium]|nr:selenocysteine-specific translation elongation factor [Gammaproteobacteria bacterium]